MTQIIYIAACPAFVYPLSLNYHFNHHYQHDTLNFRKFEFDSTNHFNFRRLPPSAMAADLSSALDDLSLGRSKGREMKNLNINVDDIPTFLTHSLPPVNSNTRLVAVCGITDADEEYTEYRWEEGEEHMQKVMGRCNQQAEGWFVTDMYLFKILYQGTCASQL
jgi:hypothetical protein